MLSYKFIKSGGLCNNTQNTIGFMSWLVLAESVDIVFFSDYDITTKLKNKDVSEEFEQFEQFKIKETITIYF